MEGIALVSENRGIIKYIILSFITLGIYAWWYTHKLAQDMNVVCEGDGENTPGLLAYVLLSMVTLGLYSYWWQYKIGQPPAGQRRPLRPDVPGERHDHPALGHLWRRALRHWPLRCHVDHHEEHERDGEGLQRQVRA